MEHLQKGLHPIGLDSNSKIRQTAQTKQWKRKQEDQDHSPVRRYKNHSPLRIKKYQESQELKICVLRSESTEIKYPEYLVLSCW